MISERIEKVFRIYLKAYLLSTFFLLLCFASLDAALKVRYTLTGEGTYDSNIPQNITEYAGWYYTPSLWVKAYSTEENMPFSVWGRAVYENYLHQRSPILNPPLGAAGLEYDFEKGIFEFDGGVDIGSYYSPDWILTKMKIGADASLEFDLDPNVIMIKASGARYDYGDDDDDAIRMEGELEYCYDFRVLKRHNFMIRELGVAFEGEYNQARSDTSTYMKTGAGLFTELKIFFADLKLDGEYDYKKYYGLQEKPADETLIYPENTYYKFSGSLEIPVWRELSFDLRGALYLKDSTFPSYDYDRYTVSMRFQWHGDLFPTDD